MNISGILKLSYSFGLLALVFMVTGCDESVRVEGRIQVITQGQSVINMPGVEVWALEENKLQTVVQKINDELASEFPKYEARMRELEPKIAGAKRMYQESALQWEKLKAQKQKIERDYDNLEQQIQKVFAVKFEDDYAARRFTSFNEKKPSTAKEEQAYQFKELGEQLQTAKRQYDLQSIPQKTYEMWVLRYNFLVRSLQTGKIETKINTPPAWKQEAEMRIQKVNLQGEKERLDTEISKVDSYYKMPDFKNEASNVWSEWEDRKAQIVTNAIYLLASDEWLEVAATEIKKSKNKGRSLFDKSLKPDFKPSFQNTRTDTDGVFRFTFPKAGTYCYVGIGERYIGNTVEKYFWVKRSIYTESGSYTFEMNNENDMRLTARERLAEFGTRDFADNEFKTSAAVYWIRLFENTFGLQDLSIKTPDDA